MTLEHGAMDHPHYRYSAMPARPTLAWPGGARLAAFVTLYVEHWELAPPADAHRDPRFVGEYGSFFPDYRTWTQREYGNRVGIFRVLDALDAAGIVPAIALNAMAITRYPQLIEKLCARPGVEFVAHGESATRMLTTKMTEADERATIAGVLDAIERATGRRPTGWCGQDFGESIRTPQLLAEAGLAYVLDWPNDDQPYRLATSPSIVSVPNHSEWDDVQAQWFRRVSPADHARLAIEAFDGLREEGAASGRVFGLGIHGWVSGMPNRIRYLRELLLALRGREGVWWTTPGAIAAHVASTTPDNA